MSTQTFKTTLTTVTYASDTKYPDTAYGNDITCKLVVEDMDRRTAVIHIGDHVFLPAHLEALLKECNQFTDLVCRDEK